MSASGSSWPANSNGWARKDGAALVHRTYPTARANQGSGAALRTDDRRKGRIAEHHIKSAVSLASFFALSIG